MLNRERYCSIAVNDGYLKDEVLLNFDRLGRSDGAKPGSLMAITAIKSDSTKPQTSSYGNLGRAHGDQSGQSADGTFSLLDQDYISSRYVFYAKDMSKEMKARHADVDVSVSRHIADAFGMKKGSQVILAPVQDPYNPIAKLHESWMLI